MCIMTEIQSDLKAGRRTEKAEWRGNGRKGTWWWRSGCGRNKKKKKEDAQNFPVFPVSHDTYSPLPPQNPSTTASSPSTHPRPAAQRIVVEPCSGRGRVGPTSLEGVLLPLCPRRLTTPLPHEWKDALLVSVVLPSQRHFSAGSSAGS